MLPSLFEEQIEHEETSRRPGARAGRAELRRGAHLLPGDGRLQHRPGRVRRARRRGQGGALDPGDRVDQRRLPRRLGPLRRAARSRPAPTRSSSTSTPSRPIPYASAASVEDRTLELVSAGARRTHRAARRQGRAVLHRVREHARRASPTPAPTASSCFNRFLQPDIDLETMTVKPELHLSPERGDAAAAALDRDPPRARPRRASPRRAASSRPRTWSSCCSPAPTP